MFHFVVVADPFSAALPSLPSALLPPSAASSSSSASGTAASSAGSARSNAPVGRGAGGGPPFKGSKAKVSPLDNQLTQDVWFHGPISRKEAEDLLKLVITLHD